MTPPLETRVLVVGMLDSIHLARWLQLFESQSLTFKIFPSSPHRRIHPELRGLLASKGPARFELARGAEWLGLPAWLADQVLSNRLRATLLARLIRKESPQIVHALELQNAGYLVARALKKLAEPKPTLVLTNYGSDIFWFSRKERHRRKLSELLSMAHRYAAECSRDVALAKLLGFSGKVLPVNPNSGGFSARQLNASLPTAQARKLILIKGYQGWVGRAHIALKAVEQISSKLRSYDIEVFSSNLSTKVLASRIARKSGLSIKAHSKGALSHDQMMSKFSGCLVYVGVSLSDGISTSMLEAMAMGAIPVQTSSSCCDEWFQETGVAIRNIDVGEVAVGIETAIRLALATDAATINRDTIKSKASREKIGQQAKSFYLP